MDDTQIIALFFARSEQAIAALSQKYGGLCMSVAMNLLHNRQDAEECVNDAYLGVWRAIPPQSPKPLSAFVCRIVRNLSINRYKQNRAQKRDGRYDLCLEELETVLSAPDSVEQRLDEAELAACIDRFLDSLSRTNRMLFVRRYWYMDDYERLARTFGLRQGAIRTRLSRIRSDLKRELEQQGVQL